MQAFFLVSNQQHWGKVGDLIFTDKFDGEVGVNVIFDKVLSVENKVGAPYVDNAKVMCSIVKHGKNKKIRVLKFKSQKRHRKVTGFRKEYTLFKIESIVVK